ncbi:MAG: hypothetical protein DME26_16405 [Verrucomicrobia bacterium]|nr:MAG: hypothetical protein DME26_16405 [Verrucomicrobiota bacterium]
MEGWQTKWRNRVFVAELRPFNWSRGHGGATKRWPMIPNRIEIEVVEDDSEVSVVAVNRGHLPLVFLLRASSLC